MIRKVALFPVLLMFLVFQSSLSLGDEKHFQTTLLGWGAEGYDVVAYFTEGKPIEGKSEFRFDWKGAKWRFASAANRDKFAGSPEKYAPQYGGYCAYAVSQGYTASIDPEAWSVVDNKLYLNYSKGVRSTWEKDIPGYIKSADKNWPSIKAGL